MNRKMTSFHTSSPLYNLCNTLYLRCTPMTSQMAGLVVHAEVLGYKWPTEDNHIIRGILKEQLLKYSPYLGMISLLTIVENNFILIDDRMAVFP